MSDGWATTIITDASFDNITGAGGWACWIASHRGKRGESGTLGRVASSTLAEMQAIVNGLWYARHLRFAMPGDEVLIQTDCIAAIWGLEGTRTNSSDEEQCRNEYLKLNNSLYVELRHVKAHTGRSENRFRANANCDRHARDAMRHERKKLLRGTHADV